MSRHADPVAMVPSRRDCIRAGLASTILTIDNLPNFGARPPLVVGVTGHRVLAEPARLGRAIGEALTRLTTAFPHRPPVLLSALAEGADRLAARCALDSKKWRLHAALPLPRADYMRDFATPESKREFVELLEQAEAVLELPALPDRLLAYHNVGRHIVENSNALLAIWDGQEAHGRGGTGEVVGLARQLGRPLAWVHAGNRRLGSKEPTSLGADQGRVSFELL